jgi:hypothetical protein
MRNVTIQVDEAYDGENYNMRVSLPVIATEIYGPHMLTPIMDRICTMLAERFVKDHGTEIIAKLDQQAIANTAIAASGNRAAQALHSIGPRGLF